MFVPPMVFTAALGLFLVLLPLGCSTEEEAVIPTEQVLAPAPAGAEKARRAIRIGAVLRGLGDPFSVAVKKGLEAEAKALEVGVDVRDGQDNDQAQVEHVEQLLKLGCDALILCPRDEDALNLAVESANRARVPVIALGRRINGGLIVGYVGADEVEGGKAQANALAAALGPKGGSIVYLQGLEGSSLQRQRYRGFHRALATHPEIQIADERFADFEKTRAKTVMASLVRRYQPGQIRAIVAQSDEMALAAAEVARTEKWSDVIVIGFDGTTAAFDAIRAGTLHATILQDGVQQGEKAVQAAVDYLHGKFVPPEQTTRLIVITKENVDQFKPMN